MIDHKHVHLHRWAGSKARILGELTAVLTEAPRRGGRKEVAVVPFWGSGADGRALRAAGYEVWGGDVCGPLVAAHVAVRNEPCKLAAELTPLDGAGREEYARVASGEAGLSEGARFLALVGMSFNGLWRVNKKGKYNVPFGQRFTFDRATLMEASRQMKGCALWTTDWCDTLVAVGSDAPRCLVYADPPYFGTFSGFAAGGFGKSEHASLAHSLAKLAAAGARVVASNRDCPEVRALYAEAARENGVSIEFRTLTARRSISCKSNTRGAAGELLVVMELAE